MGVIVKHVDVSLGKVAANLNEGLFLKRKKSSVESPSGSEKPVGPSADSMATNKPSKNQQVLLAFSKYTAMFPEKVMNIDVLPVFNHCIL